jgi:hypothetical protein
MEQELERRLDQYVSERKDVTHVRAVIFEHFGIEGIRALIRIAERRLAGMERGT